MMTDSGLSASVQASDSSFTNPRSCGSPGMQTPASIPRGKKKVKPLKANPSRPEVADSAVKPPEMEQAKPTVGPKAARRPRKAGSNAEAKQSLATKNSYLTGAAHQQDQDFRISHAQATAELAEAGMASSQEHVETMLKKVTAGGELMLYGTL